MANKQITGLTTTTKTLCGFDYMVIERLTGGNLAVTSNAQLSSLFNFVTSQPITATVADSAITENKISDNQSFICICGRLATGLHERGCKIFQDKVTAETIKELSYLLES